MEKPEPNHTRPHASGDTSTGSTPGTNKAPLPKSTSPSLTSPSSSSSKTMSKTAGGNSQSIAKASTAPPRHRSSSAAAARMTNMNDQESFSTHISTSSLAANGLVHKKKDLRMKEKNHHNKNKIKIKTERPKITPEQSQKRSKYIAEVLNMSHLDGSVTMKKIILNQHETLSNIAVKAMFNDDPTNPFKKWSTISTNTPFASSSERRTKKMKVTGSPTKAGTGRKAMAATSPSRENLIDLFNQASNDDDEVVLDKKKRAYKFRLGDDEWFTDDDDDNKNGILFEINRNRGGEDEDDDEHDDSDSYMDGAGEVEEVGNGLGETLGPDFEAETVLAYQRAKKAWRHVLPPDCSSLNTKFQFWGSKEPPLSNNAKVNEEKDIKWQLCKFKNNPPPRGCRYIINSAGAPLTFNRWTNTNDIMKARLNVVCGGCLKDKFNCGEMVHGRFVTQAMFAFMDENIRKQHKVTRAQAEAAYKNSFNEHKRTITWIKSPKDERTYDPKTYEPPECMKKASFVVCMAIYDHCKDKGNHNNPINLSSVLRETHDNFHSFLKMDKIIHHLLWPNLKYVPCTPGAF